MFHKGMTADMDGLPEVLAEMEYILMETGYL